MKPTKCRSAARVFGLCSNSSVGLWKPSQCPAFSRISASLPSPMPRQYLCAALSDSAATSSLYSPGVPAGHRPKTHRKVPDGAVASSQDFEPTQPLGTEQHARQEDADILAVFEAARTEELKRLLLPEQSTHLCTPSRSHRGSYITLLLFCRRVVEAHM